MIVINRFGCMQTIAVNKRNAGLPSAVPRATLNDEELVSFGENHSNKLKRMSDLSPTCARLILYIKHGLLVAL